MKLFMLVSRVPWPLEKGDKLRAYHQLERLARHHEVMLCCLSDEEVPTAAIEHLRTITPHIEIIRLSKPVIGLRLMRALFSDKPFQVHYFFQQKAAARIRRSIESFSPDRIYCQLIRTSEYVKHLHQYDKTLDYMDALSGGYRRRIPSSAWWIRPFVREEAKRLMAYENLIYEYFEHHTIISTQDRELIMHARRNDITIVPNGVDADFFAPMSSVKKYDIVFTGNMSYPPNVECARRIALEIMPLILKKIPTAVLLIAGATPGSDVKELASGHVHVSGWMEDIREAYDGSRIFMAPMQSGSGLQNKLLEAMSMQMPCITTSLAATPVGARHAEHIIIAESNEDLALNAIRILQSTTQQAALGSAARQYVKDQFSWENAIALLENTWEKSAFKAQ